ncbi:MAG: hypothetical protein DRP01_02115 [Archaeoglobales archaeon]|nr:MAG: hypothetical protein DRP01_02115 [Archaeoglobales archaeon]
MELKGISNKGMQRIASKVATVDTEVWDLADRCREALGDDIFIEALLKAMSTEEAYENLEFIARMKDI